MFSILLHKKCIHGSQLFHGGCDGTVYFHKILCETVCAIGLDLVQQSNTLAIKCIVNHYKNSCSRSNHSLLLKTQYSYLNRTQKWFEKVWGTGVLKEKRKSSILNSRDISNSWSLIVSPRQTTIQVNFLWCDVIHIVCSLLLITPPKLSCSLIL